MAIDICRDGAPLVQKLDYRFFNQSYPDFHLCFHDIVATAVPTGFLFVLAVPYLLYLAHVTSYTHKWSYLVKAKLSLLVVALVCCFAELLSSVILVQDSIVHLSPAHYIRLLLLILSFTLVIVIVTLEHKKKIVASMYLYLFWLLLLIVEACRVRALAILGVHNSYKTQLFFYTTVGLTTVSLLQLILFGFIADKTPETAKMEIDSKDIMKAGGRQTRLPCPEDSSCVISRLTFWWSTWLLILGYRKELTMSDLRDVPEDFKPAVSQRNFDGNFKMLDTKKDASVLKIGVEGQEEVQLIPAKEDKELNGETMRFVKALAMSFGPWYLYAGVLTGVADCLQFVSPMLLEALISFFIGPPGESDLSEYPIWCGLIIVVCMFVISCFIMIIHHQYNHLTNLIGMRVRSAITSAVFAKSLNLTNASRQKTTTAETVNLIAVDASHCERLCVYFHGTWTCCVEIIFAITLLYMQIGPAVFCGVAVLLVSMVVSGIMARVGHRLQTGKMKKKDERLKMTNEVISGMRVIKFFAWEPSFEEKIGVLRNQELRYVRNQAIFGAIWGVIWSSVPALVALTSFAAYSVNHTITASVIFVSLSLFGLLQGPMIVLPLIVDGVINTSVSAKRIAKFLALEELETEAVQNYGETCCVENGTFAWDNVGPTCLEDISFSVPTGSLVAVVGSVGSGKSSLISAMLGELHKLSGEVNIAGSVAYVPQQAWIQNATVQENILFGETKKGKKYKAVLAACSLTTDLEVLQHGDQTEIGEKGINLSGGQKQRVALARAAFADADTYMLDDPLSAVDSHVAAHLFKEVIGPQGMLGHKTRFWVTHRINFLSQCDHILMIEKGRLVDQGKFADLHESSLEFRRLIDAYTNEEDHEPLPIAAKKGLRTISQLGVGSTTDSGAMSPDGMSPTSAKGPPSLALETEKLIQDEKMEIGSVSLAVFVAYAKSLGVIVFIIVMFCILVSHFSRVASDLTLAGWADAQGEETDSQNRTVQNSHYLGMYSGFVGLQTIAVFIGTITMAFGALRAARWWHNEMLTHLTRGFMSFFEATPIGRILNKFSKDMEVIDCALRDNFNGFCHTIFSCIAILVVISAKLPLFLAVCVPLAVCYTVIQRIYVATQRQIRRLESTTRSPIISHFSESLQGVSSIRAYKREEQFIGRCLSLLEEHLITSYWSGLSSRWLAMRLEFVGSCVILTAGMLCVFTRETIRPTEAGLILMYALKVTGALEGLVRILSDVETNIISVERVKEYCDLPQEAAWTVEPGPPANWPSQGRIRFEKLCMKYRPELDLILRDVTLDIAQGEKVGVVGRTGSGKSTLMLSLFRLVEPYSGAIFIDDVDISSVGLHQLRGKITIIPQDPTLFTGTVRFNMDPFNEADDAAIWAALESAQMKEPIDELDGKLSAPVTEGGENFSVGQRQLLCMARALLRKSKVLVMDEATAAVDLDTDALIQTTIRKEFTDCTVLTIAHRLDTVMDYDKILVLDAGVVKEYDSPVNLLKDRLSHFYGMCKAAGIHQ